MKSRRSLVYLDNAATTFPKPPEVIRRVRECMTYECGNPGRGSHALAMAAAEEIYRCREVAAAFFGASAERVIFTLNTTHALNIAIKGLLRAGDHAVCSDMEHNSVYRPLWKLQKAGVITLDTFDTYPHLPHVSPELILSSLSARITPLTHMVVCAHASNICSATLPIAEIGAYCHRRGILFVVDGAQSAGALDINVDAMHIDALCVPGHKGLYGPQGTGMLILGKDVRMETLMEGGNGTDSLLGSMSEEPPERYEPGTLQTPAIAGLRTGIEYVSSVGIDVIRAHEAQLYRRAWSELADMRGVTVYAPTRAGSVLLFSVKGISSEEIGKRLDENGICVRPGFHCSALGHRTLGTPREGAVRVSFGYKNTERDADALVRAVKEMVSE